MRPALHLSKNKHRECLVTIHGRLGEQINARSMAIEVFERMDDEHHVLHVYLVLPKRGGAGFAALSFLDLWFSSRIVGLCLR